MKRVFVQSVLVLVFVIALNPLAHGGQRWVAGNPVAHLTAKELEAGYKEGELLIKFHKGVDPLARRQAFAKLQATLLQHFPKTDVYRVQLPASLDVKKAIESLRGHEHIKFVEPNGLIEILDNALPSDPYFGLLWNLRNTGQTGGKVGADIDILDAWSVMDVSSGREVVVAVIDTGVDYTHEDLKDKMWVNPSEIPNNGVDDDGNGYVDDVYGFDAWHDWAGSIPDPMDDNGHGTHCAGIIGAAGNNGMGVVGITGLSPNVRIMALKFMSWMGYGTTTDAIQCVEYVIKMKERGVNVRAISASWHLIYSPYGIYDAVKEARDHDILLVVAAGNDGMNNDVAPTYPASFDLDNVIAVAATDHNDHLAEWSNYGPNTVHVGAPGVDILSSVPLWWGEEGWEWTYPGYEFFSGTSMATPHVAGLAALIVDQYPQISYRQVKSRILATVDPLPNLTGKVVSGGRINAGRAIQLGLGDMTPPTITSVQPAEGSSLNKTKMPVQVVAEYSDDTVVDASSVTLSIDGYAVNAVVSANKATITLSLSDGNHRASLSLSDLSGNATGRDWAFNVDTKPPTFSVLTPASYSTMSTSRPAISANYSDAVSGIATPTVHLYVDSVERTSSATGTRSRISYVPADDLSSGAHPVKIEVSDHAGNSATTEWTFIVSATTVDTTPPSVQVVSPNGGETWTMGEVRAILWTATDNFGVTRVDVAYSLNAGSSWVTIATGLSNSGSYSWSVPNVSSTTALIRVEGLDAAGNRGIDLSNGYFTLTSTPANVPPVADAGSDQTVKEGVVVTLDGSRSSDPDDGIASYYWEQVAGAPTVILSDSRAVRPTFTAPVVSANGTILAFRLTVTDRGGQPSTDTCTVTVSKETPPPGSNQIRVRVLTYSGYPRPNVGVFLIQRSGVAFSGQKQTNQSGEVVFENLAPGGYDVYRQDRMNWIDPKRVNVLSGEYTVEYRY